MSEKPMSLIEKLAKIRSMAEVVSKDKTGYNYKYTPITEILAKITAGMKKYQVSLIPIIVPGTVSLDQNTVINTKFIKTGTTYENKTTEMLIKAEMIFRWVNDENPDETIDVPWFITGSQADPSQAFGSALTYCTRYFLISYFQIAQEENDVDAYRSKQKEAEDAEDKAIAAQIVQEIDIEIKEYLSKHEDDESKGKVRDFCAKFVKGGNYLSIKKPDIASKMLEAFREKFINNQEVL